MNGEGGSAIVEKIKKKYPALVKRLSIAQLKDVAEFIDQHFLVMDESHQVKKEEMEKKYQYLQDSYEDLEKELKQKSEICKEYGHQFGALKTISEKRKVKEEKAQSERKRLQDEVQRLTVNVTETNSKLEVLELERAATPDVNSVVAEFNNFRDVSNENALELSEEVTQLNNALRAKEQTIKKVNHELKETKTIAETVAAYKEVNEKLRNDMAEMKTRLAKLESSEQQARKEWLQYQNEAKHLNKMVKVQQAEIHEQRKTIVGMQRRA